MTALVSPVMLSAAKNLVFGVSGKILRHCAPQHDNAARSRLTKYAMILSNAIYGWSAFYKFHWVSR